MSLFLATNPASDLDKDSNLSDIKTATEINLFNYSFATGTDDNNNNNSSVVNDNLTSFVSTPISSIDVEPPNDAIDVTLLCIKGLIFGTIIIGAVLGNALVIISVQKNRKLR